MSIYTQSRCRCTVHCSWNKAKSAVKYAERELEDAITRHRIFVRLSLLTLLQWLAVPVTPGGYKVIIILTSIIFVLVTGASFFTFYDGDSVVEAKRRLSDAREREVELILEENGTPRPTNHEFKVITQEEDNR